MSNSFEAEVMDELYDAAEGPAQRYYGDAFEEEEFDALEEESEGFEDEFDSADERDELEDYADEMDVDSMEDAVADALEEEDTDEFFRRIRRIARGAARLARRAGRDHSRSRLRRQGYSAAASAVSGPYRRGRRTCVACR